jgi:hypothetical protein
MDLRNPVPHIGRTLHTQDNPLTPVLPGRMIPADMGGLLKKVNIVHDFFK